MNIFTKNVLLLLLAFSFISTSRAQLQPSQGISGSQKIDIRDSPAKKKLAVAVIDPLKDITRKISDTMDTYRSYPNNKNTWAIIINKANNILFEYYLSGYLKGKSSKEAFFVKMGPETMTAADMQNNKMILVAGIATKRPAEFEVLRFEKTGAAISNTH
jgi:phage tail sheath protein FI